MATDLPIEKRFPILCEIARAQHFAWREAVRQVCPEVDPAEVTMRMWEVTGRQTARAYLKRIDPGRPLPAQVAAGIAWSSQCMGEDAVVEAGASDDEVFVRHRACPWRDWHARLGLLEEDRPGCDRWFLATLDTFNEGTGASIRFETLASLPEGASSCLRRLWVQR